MGRNVRGCPGLFSPNKTTCNHNRSFWNVSDRTRLSKFHWKRISSNGEAVGHPWLLFLARKNIIFCYYCKLFISGYALAQLSIPLLSSGTTLVPPFWSRRYLVLEKVLNEGCNSFIYSVLWHCPLNALQERFWRHLFGPRLCHITDFYH